MLKVVKLVNFSSILMKIGESVVTFSVDRNFGSLYLQVSVNIAEK